MAQLSILELGRTREGHDRRTALEQARIVAQHAEALGYQRIWVAEHHNMASVTTAATSLVVQYLAEGTKTIRVGAGGIMLPNHSPYIIAEHFGTLATLYPDRIDLGLGRAPGTDQAAMRAIRRDLTKSDRFPQEVIELQGYLGPAQPGMRLEAVPGSGTHVPLWILGSSLFGAQLAAELGLPYGFASHFAPQARDEALQLYRDNFKPSEQLSAPYALIGVNIIAAESDAEARYLATSQQMSFTDMVRGQRGPMRPPIADIETYWSAEEKHHAMQMLSCSIIGSPTTVRRGMENLLKVTQADELMVISDVYDFEKRLRSFELIAHAGKELAVPALN